MSDSISHNTKLLYMLDWCKRHGLTLQLAGECGLGRECVGVIDGSYPDYEWYDEAYEREDSNGDVWTPEDAYHKHPCVAVLGRGEKAEAQLYEWLKWFEANGFVYQSMPNPKPPTNIIEMMMGRHTIHRMVKK